MNSREITRLLMRRDRDAFETAEYHIVNYAQLKLGASRFID
jgi:hypothetical protein